MPLIPGPSRAACASPRGTPEEVMRMTVNEGLRLMAGSFVLGSVVLGYFVHPGFYALTVFVALNLIQSAFSRTCPAMWMLRKAGLKDDTCR
jgi:hypothetical protein